MCNLNQDGFAVHRPDPRDYAHVELRNPGPARLGERARDGVVCGLFGVRRLRVDYVLAVDMPDGLWPDIAAPLMSYETFAQPSVLGREGKEGPADDVHLSQRHWLVAFPPQVAVLRPRTRARLDQTVPDQDLVDAHPRRNQHLAHPPTRADPASRARGGSRTPPLQTPPNLVRARLRPLGSIRLCIGSAFVMMAQLGMQLSLHPELGGKLRQRNRGPTSRAARYRCSTTDTSTSPIPTSREPAAFKRQVTENQIRGTSKARVETEVSSIYRDKDIAWWALSLQSKAAPRSKRRRIAAALAR
jgi:hypothetical protein